MLNGYWFGSLKRPRMSATAQYMIFFLSSRSPLSHPHIHPPIEVELEHGVFLYGSYYGELSTVIRHPLILHQRNTQSLDKTYWLVPQAAHGQRRT
jgi:hypothetical protein